MALYSAPHGIKLVPWWGNKRRTWYFRLPEGQRTEEETQKELNDWKEAFTTSCQSAELPSECDAVTAIAFSIALEKTRWSCGIWVCPSDSD
jgi:hypothetical protein